MPIEAPWFARYGVVGDATLPPPLPLGNPPSLLPDITAGVPASNMIGVGGYPVGSGLSPGGFATYKSQGWAGFAQSLDNRNGGPLGKNATTQNDSMTGPYVWQRANEGWSAVGINVIAPGNQNAPNNGIGERNVHNADASFRGFWEVAWFQMTNWFDDAEAAALATNWAGLAGATNYLGLKGFYTDSENRFNPLNIPAGQTRATTYAKIEQRGYEVGLQVYANYPGFHWNFYSPVPSGSLWDRVYRGPISVGGAGTGTTSNRDTTTSNVNPANSPGCSPEMPFVLGVMKAGAELGSTGTISWLDHHIGYRADYSGLVGSLDDAIKVSWAGMIHRLSADLAPAVRDHWMGKYHWKAYHWGTTDPGFYATTEPDSATYNSWLLTFRRWSGDGERFEFIYGQPGSPDQAPSTASRWNGLANGYQAVPGRPAGMLAAASTASQDSSAISVGAVSQSRAGSTVTLTFTVAHAYGPRNVHWKLFAANGTTVAGEGEAAMAWSLINTVPYPNPVTTTNSFMTCTCTIPNATAGLYVTLDVYTVIGQRTSRRVQVL